MAFLDPLVAYLPKFERIETPGQGSAYYLCDRALSISVINDVLLKKSTKYLHVYCDTFTIDATVMPARAFKWLRIFARQIVTGSAGATMKIAGQAPRTTILTNKIPEEFVIQFEGHSQSVPVELITGDIGFSAMLNGAGAVMITPVLFASPSELENNDFSDYDGSKPLRKNEALPRLMRNLFDYAVDLMEQDRSTKSNTTTIISICQYIVAITRTSPAQVALYEQACTLIRRLHLPTGARYYVPVLDCAECYTQLSKDFKTAELLTNAFNMFVSEENAEKRSDKITKEIIAQFAYSHRDYGLDKTEAEKDLSEKANALSRRKIELEEFTEKVSGEGEKFKIKLDAWVEKQKEKMMWQTLQSVIELGVAVGAAVSTGGATAGAAGPAVANAAKAIDAAKETAEKVSKLKKLWEILKKVVERIKKIKAVYDVFSKWQNAMAASKGDQQKILDALTDVETLKKTAKIADTGTVDFTKLLMEWQDFDLDVEELFIEITGTAPDISDDVWRPYRLLFKKMTIRGVGVIRAMQDLQLAQDRYARATVDEARYFKRKLDIEAQVDNIQTKTVTYTATKQVIADELISLRRWIFLTLHENILAVLYFLGASDWPSGIKLSASKSIIGATNDASQLQHWLDSKKPEWVKAQEETFEFDTDQGPTHPQIFGERWKELLQSGEKQIPFIIDMNHSSFNKYKAIVVREVGVTFDGIKPAGTVDSKTAIPLVVRVGPELKRRDPSLQLGYYYEHSPTIRFEKLYAAPYTIKVPGKVAEMNYIKPSLFSSGIAGVHRFNWDSWDLTEVSKIAVVFQCLTITYAS